MKKEFILHSDYIELIKLLKLLGVVKTGGIAKILVEEGKVLVNGKTETKKRCKLRFGDVVDVLGTTIQITK